MPHDFAEYQPELEPQASSARGGGPPRKLTGIGVLDPPRPPKRPLGPIPSAPTSLLWRIAAAVLFAGLAAMIFFLLFAGHCSVRATKALRTLFLFASGLSSQSATIPA